MSSVIETVANHPTEKSYYLREDVVMEPLINQWYAWPNLVAPLTYSLYAAKVHKRLMKSFINNFELHIMANQNAAMAGGGEFIDCSAEQVADVQQLLEKLESQDNIHSELAQAIVALDELVRGHTDGTTLEPLYEKVPELLKGFVELTMDLNYQPAFRLIEGLLYHSDYYKPELQSLSFRVLASNGHRPFVFSTPRLPTEDSLSLPLPFADASLDQLFKARELPISAADINRLFAAKNAGGLDPFALFTEVKPQIRHQPSDEVQVKYLGHAGLLIESSEVSILVDPVIASRAQEYAEDVTSFSELPAKIDYVCLTHNHSDHINLETLLQLRYKIGTIIVPKNNGGSLADPSLKLLLTQLNFNVIEIDEMQTITLSNGKIIGIPFLGEHGDLNIRSKTGWYFEINGKKIYAGADSSNLEPRIYDMVHKMTGDLDILAIGMECVGAPFTWLYGALTTRKVSREVKESRRLNGSDAQMVATMMESFQPKRVLIYAMGLEPWFSYFMGLDYSDDSQQLIESKKIIEHCQQRNIPVQVLNGKQQIDV